MPVQLVTVPNVPIVSTGEYTLASGTTTFSQEDLADAVKAAGDPTVPSPRLKLGHTDPRFETAVASGELDGEPAFGTVQNLRLSDDGQTVLGDYVDVPEWLADSLQSSYPGRSIEGGFGYTAPSGRQYKLVIARVALLGVTWPGVTSLADLREVLEQNGEVQDDGLVEAKSERFVIARIRRPNEKSVPRTGSSIVAGLDLGSIRQQFVGDLDDGEVPQVPDDQPQADDVGPQTWWWPRSIRVEDDGSLCLIVDDDEGHLISVPFTVTQGDLVYGQPQLVIEQYVPVTSDPDEVTAKGPRTMTFGSVRAARPSNTTEVHTMDIDPAVLRTRLGLADDADEAAITEALTAKPVVETTPTTPVIPEGMTLVDEATLAEVKQGAEQGVAVAARLAREDRDKIILAAIQEGRFPISRKDHYERMWEKDADGTRSLLTASAADGGLAPGLVPVRSHEIGGAGDGDATTNTTEQEMDVYFAASFPNEHSRLAGKTSRVNVRQEA